MSATLSASALSIPHSKIREIADLAMGMDGVLKLYFGESNVPTPDFIKEAAEKAMRDGFTFYTSNAGIPSLREALADYYGKLHGVELDPSTEICITASGVQALNVGIRNVLDPGDEGLVLTPNWPNGSAIIQMSNAVPREVPYVFANGRYAVDFEALERAVTPRTRMLLYTSPSNPLGWVATEQEQEDLLDFTRRHGLWLIADEVYERVFYGNSTAPSILRKCTREDAVIVVQSFSKSYCMTGWRLGWLVGRKDLAMRAMQLNEYVISCAAGFVQRAAETALVCGERTLKEMVAKLQDNRDYCLSALSGIDGVTIPNPDGAFYLFAKIDGVTDSSAFCKQLLRECKVGLAPGVAFGAGGEGNVRICYASDRPILEEAMGRLKTFLHSR
jgi:aspartate/methionine/tyrosine aminotransferase